MQSANTRSSHPEVFLRKGVLKICSKFTGEHPWRSVILIKLQSSVFEIALRHGCSHVNLLHIFRTPFPRNTSWWLLLQYRKCKLTFFQDICRYIPTHRYVALKIFDNLLHIIYRNRLEKKIVILKFCLIVLMLGLTNLIKMLAIPS